MWKKTLQDVAFLAAEQIDPSISCGYISIKNAPRVSSRGLPFRKYTAGDTSRSDKPLPEALLAMPPVRFTRQYIDDSGKYNVSVKKAPKSSVDHIEFEDEFGDPIYIENQKVTTFHTDRLVRETIERPAEHTEHRTEHRTDTVTHIDSNDKHRVSAIFQATQLGKRLNKVLGHDDKPSPVIQSAKSTSGASQSNTFLHDSTIEHIEEKLQADMQFQLNQQLASLRREFEVQLKTANNRISNFLEN